MLADAQKRTARSPFNGVDLEQLNASCCFFTGTCSSSHLSFRRLYTATSPRAHLISLCLTHGLRLKCLLLYHYLCVVLQTFFTETRLSKFCRRQECMKSTSLVALLVCFSGVPAPTDFFITPAAACSHVFTYSGKVSPIIAIAERASWNPVRIRDTFRKRSALAK